ncbi:DExH-box ATP-dependent RNA helicase DExH12 [Rosa chinensis]|uniref:DExH-box ATP-dependent RNA helicase DExH12 n=1 Tax=Rosa chinensis TaxID=74649 RepID=UPI001AD925C4|nr:DExH-box ATP-dependent RNA helicase DExH12 [Rosa chinensis]
MDQVVKLRAKATKSIRVPYFAVKINRHERLVRVADMPRWSRKAFDGIHELNRVDSIVYDTALFETDNILLSAPTGPGEGNVAILTILQQFSINMDRCDDYSVNHRGYKVLYLASATAIVRKVVAHLSARLRSFGAKVKEMSGHDQTLTHSQIEETQIIVTTPKDWEMITRKFGEHTCTLVIIDGVHLLHSTRGPVLESIVARTVRMLETTKKHTRLVGLSAVFPNYEDVARFLRVDDNGLFNFDNSCRPVPLSLKCVGMEDRNPLSRFQLMNQRCYENVIAVPGNHPVLIFVHSENQTVETARYIRDTAVANGTIDAFKKEGSVTILQSSINSAESNDLKDLLPYGIAFHHAGLSRDECQKIEELFADGRIQVLVSTATLAWGVNVRAHTVIIRGTQVYDPEKGAWAEISTLDVMQMLSLAGRPQYDSIGEGVIITEDDKQQDYLSLLNQGVPIQSYFRSSLEDQLNAEIVLGTVKNFSEACTWLQYTYLYVQWERDQRLWGLEAADLPRDVTLKEKVQDLITTAASMLASKKLIEYDEKSGYFQVTDLGRIASYYYITHTTISAYYKHVEPTMEGIEFYQLFSSSEEFKYVTVRQDEKMELESLNIDFRVKESLEEASGKINVLLQAYISQKKLEELSLTYDMVYITQCAERFLRALFEIIVLKCGRAQLAVQALNLCKMVNKRMRSTEAPIEIKLAASVQPITRTVLRVELTISTPDFPWEDGVHGCAEPFWLIVEGNKQSIHHEYFLLKNEDHTLNFTVEIPEEVEPQYVIHVVSDRWVHQETSVNLNVEHLQLPEKNPPPTELAGLNQIPVTELMNQDYEALYDLEHFNHVQSMVFKRLYYSDDNVLVAAPTGCGKIICAEFAVLRNHQKDGDKMRVVYITAMECLAKERHTDWQRRFGRSSDGLGLCVVELTGDTVTDLELLQKGQIIISTPEKWDALSRSKKGRGHAQEVSLFIIDEVHLIVGKDGPVFENIVSRMRYISSKGSKKIRIVALSTSLANANDVGEWIGATSHDLFNFAPDARPVPLELHIQGVDLANFQTVMNALAKPTHTAIVQHGKPALVYVPMGKHVQVTALDLVTYSDADGGGTPSFSEWIMESIENISDKTLRRTLSHGVGYLHEDLTTYDQNIVSELFKADHIQVCVMSGSMCWEVPLSARLVVVMGTQYDDQENFHFEYPVTDLLQMMDHAGRHRSGVSGKCVIFCQASRKAFYMKFLKEALPVESRLHHYLHDYLNAEVVAGIIKKKQDVADYLKQTFLYQRLKQNPRYYNLQGDLSDYLSQLVTDTLRELEKRRLISIENGEDLLPLSCGRICSDYYIRYTTVEHFRRTLTSETKMKGLLEILAHASEYSQLSLLPGEEELIQRLINQQRFSIEIPNCRNPHVKANALLQAYFSRNEVGGNLSSDQRQVLLSASRLLPAMVWIIYRRGWLQLALLAMRVSQMVTQGMWEYDSMLLQLPHFTKEMVERCQHNEGKRINTVSDLVNMKKDERHALLETILEMTDNEMEDIERYCRHFPSNKLTKLKFRKNERAGEIITLEIEITTHRPVGAVDTPRFPKKTKEEGWWLVVGDTSTNSLLTIKEVPLQKKAKVELQFMNSAIAGQNLDLTLFLISDSRMGCDKEKSFTVA